MRIMSLHKQLEYSKGLFMYRVLNNEAPKYMSNLYIRPPWHYPSSRNYHFSFRNKRILLWRHMLSFTHFSSFKLKFRVHLEAVTVDGL